MLKLPKRKFRPSKNAKAHPKKVMMRTGHRTEMLKEIPIPQNSAMDLRQKM
jgi:hypothetical protein